MKIAVSGATGYLGRHIVAVLRRHGHDIVGLTRRLPPQSDAGGYLPFDIGGTCPAAEDFRRLEIDGLIHCAWDFAARSGALEDDPNVRSARQLMDAARGGGVARLIDISTMSAYDGCRSRYGRTKLMVEKMFLAEGGVVLRPGLIWSEDAGGMVGTLDRLARRLPVVPLIGSGRRPLYLIHADDLAEIVCALAQGAAAPAGRIISVAVPDPVSLRAILRTRAAACGRSPLLVPIPWPLIWLGVRILESVLPRIGLRSDSVLGFVYSDLAPHFDGASLARWLPAGLRRFG